ncbi:4-hydroxy-tetrahydrodipicolinate synthase [Phycicoccus sp. SLBN-51]|jgi:4-hydroxy-tetrahydrodipicolinate synthase|uniref:4-hydroxy-tetrahydrodipicolinate synthase n=1 Tax=Phycicoccus sp. SLBN-51 TaxID=2768447 RepID=UPI001150D5DF|nr:4-hydroxy-tetrahydrodipicolinate synthase [Phycicoccus sp. SLBN-51]TQJ51370.1 4-hydroxy-tetrahydrodipicolinate synthase [Phycicoccus sp. SLBN-51]
MTSASPFGRVVTAMVSPMRPDGSLDLDAAQRVAQHLIDHGHDGIVVNGTTGESPTTTDAEKVELIRAVVEVVGDRARVTAGAGTNDTAHSVELARAAEAAGAHALLVVAPYYNKPPQSGLRAHCTAVADATGLPVMLYDIPGRSGIPFATETLLELARHPRIRAVKDAKGDLWAATKVMSQTDLLWFSGDDVANLAHLANGATGVVSVVGHVAGDVYAEMVAAMDKGDLTRARELHRQVVPAVDAIMNITQGAIMAKAALKEIGVLDSAAVRLPLVEATPEQAAAVRGGLDTSGLM